MSGIETGTVTVTGIGIGTETVIVEADETDIVIVTESVKGKENVKNLVVVKAALDREDSDLDKEVGPEVAIVGAVSRVSVRKSAPSWVELDSASVARDLGKTPE